MKFKNHTQSRRRGQGAPSISLFPFLAVLICTMGALVPLLFAITRQARLQAAQTATAKIAEKRVEIQAEYETAQWRIEQLKTSRQKTDEQVADARLELGHLEDHARRLREQIPRLDQTAAELDRLGADDSQQYSQQVAEWEKIKAEINVAQRQVADARAETSSRNKSYAVIPYEGPNQTRRRPIYLECSADAVILQPEGIEFVESDFEGPLGPGNPLASALRAVREYLMAQQNFDPQREGEPYPLLLVRPDGIPAYYAARAAMKSWATEFGYELIDADWKLAYQPPDAQLAESARQVVVTARARQERLIAAAPAAYAKRPKVTYRASASRGGFVREEGGDDDDQAPPGYQAREPSGRIGRSYGSAGVSTGEGSPPGPTEAQQVASLYDNAGGVNPTSGGLGGTTASGGAPAIAGGGVPAIAGSAMPSMVSDGYGGIGNYNSNISNDGSGGTNVSGGYPATSGNGGIGDYNSNMSNDGSGGTNASGGYPATSYNNAVSRAGTGGAGKVDVGSKGSPGPATEQNNSSGQTLPEGNVTGDRGQGTGNRGYSEPIKLPEGYVIGRPPSEQATSNQASKASGQSSQDTAGHVMLPRPGEWQPPPEPSKIKPVEEKLDSKKTSKYEKSISQKRGRNWGLPDAAYGSVPITRPIRIECQADKLMIVPEPGLAGGKSIAVGERTDRSINTFISAIWEHMDAWGIAGRGMYWRPVLHVYVAPGAEQRFADLQSLLEGSGLTVERR